MEHVALAERADLLLVAPATAHALARAALGLADDFLGRSCSRCAARSSSPPRWTAACGSTPRCRPTSATLRARGATVLEPGEGALASGLTGQGRLPEVADIVEAAERLLWPRRDLVGDHVLVTAGPTREPLDPVRYLTNRSSGRMGYAIAAQAVRRGAAVTLVTGPTHLAPPPGVRADSGPDRPRDARRGASRRRDGDGRDQGGGGGRLPAGPPRDREDRLEAGRAPAGAPADARHPAGARDPEGRPLPRRIRRRDARPPRARAGQAHQPRAWTSSSRTT